MAVRKSFFILLSSMLFLIGTACQKGDRTGGAAGGTYEVLSKKEYSDRLAKADDYILVDVRTPKEYQEGHIEGAINIDFLEPPVFDERFSKIDTTQTLMIYCRSGKRSGRSAEKLQEMGFKKIYDLEGGYLNWQEKK